MSRRFRALKIWLSLRYHGLNAFRDAIRADLDHAQQLAALVRANEKLELLAPVELSAVCFRFVWHGSMTRDENDLNALNERILQRVVQRGHVFISNAAIRESSRCAPALSITARRRKTCRRWSRKSSLPQPSLNRAFPVLKPAPENKHDFHRCST